MKTTTEPAAPDTEPPEPGNAFSVFVATDPLLREIAQLLEKTFPNDMEVPPYTFAANLDADVGNYFWRRNRLRWLEVTAPLEEKLTGDDSPAQRKLRKKLDAISRKFSAEWQAVEPNRDRIKAGIAAIGETFAAWTKNDPAGIAASAKDAARREFFERRRQAEAAEQDANHRAWEEARRAERQAIGLAELRQQIGETLLKIDFHHPDIDGAAAKAFVDWCSESSHSLTSTNALLIGPPRLGKTRALASAALATAANWGFEEVAWVTGHDFAELVSDLGSNERREPANIRIRELAEIRWLFIDDLGGAGFTQQRTARFFNLADYRYRHKLPTYISSNFSPSQLKRLFTNSGEAHAEGIRILGRLLGTRNEPLARIFNFAKPTP